MRTMWEEFGSSCRQNKIHGRISCSGTTNYQKKNIGMVNQRTWIQDKACMENHSRLMLMCGLADKPVYVHISSDINDQSGVLEFVVEAFKTNFLHNGDYLVMDNAPVHWGSDSVQLLSDFCASRGINLRFLPKYSIMFQ